MKQKTHEAIASLLTCTHSDDLLFTLEPAVGAVRTVSVCRHCGASRLSGERWRQPAGLRALFVTLLDPTLLEPADAPAPAPDARTGRPPTRPERS
jgi:hypothetical protein